MISYVLKECIVNEDMECGEPYVNIVGVYKNKETAEKKMQELIKDNIENYDFVIDSEDNHRIFYGEQENWDNYIEYEIIEKEIEEN